MFFHYVAFCLLFNVGLGLFPDLQENVRVMIRNCAALIILDDFHEPGDIVVSRCRYAQLLAVPRNRTIERIDFRFALAPHILRH